MQVDRTENNKRIAKNTLYLYTRMFFTMAIALYTSRIVLRVLGASDYGLYNVVGGIVTMFTMLSGTLTAGTQRFFSYAIGESKEELLNKSFSIAFEIHILVSLIFILLAETVGLWFLNTQMSIPEGRVNAAQWVYQFSVLAFTVNLLQIPYQSSIISHEDMHIYAYMSIYDVVMKLLIVFLIQYSAYDKLIFYAFLIFIINISNFLIYKWFCVKKYKECVCRLVLDKQLTRSMLSFNGWNIIGGATGFVSGQGINLLLNVFFDTIVNAAKGLSSTINTYVTGFVTNFQMAANPQIIQLYAIKDYDGLYRLVVNNCRIAGYLFLIIAIPASLEISHILRIWLGDYPDYTEVFTLLVFLQSFPYSVDRPLVTLINATGNVKWYNLTSGIWILLLFPISLILLKMGFSPVAPCLTCAIMWMADLFWTAFYSHKYALMPIKTIVKDIYLNVILGGLVMLLVPGFLTVLLDDGWTRFFLVCITSIFTSLIVLYFWGMTPGMKLLVMKKFRNNRKLE